MDGIETSSGLRGRRSNTDPSHPLMTPSSPQAVHCHSIDGGRSARNRAKWPGHGRRPGRRRHGSALTQGCPPSPAVAARTISVRCSAMRRAGTGTSSGMSRKCRRSETNTTHGIAVYFRRPIFAPLLDRALRHLPPVVGHALPAWRGFPPGTYSVHGAPIMSPALPVKTHATMPVEALGPGPRSHPVSPLPGVSGAVDSGDLPSFGDRATVVVRGIGSAIRSAERETRRRAVVVASGAGAADIRHHGTWISTTGGGATSTTRSCFHCPLHTVLWRAAIGWIVG